MQIFHRRALTFGLQRFNGVCRGVISDGVKRILLLLVTGVVLAVQAQDQPFVHHTERGKDDTSAVVAAKDLQSFLRNGRFFGHTRLFSMLTDNSEGLTDYQANAVGVGIGYDVPVGESVIVGVELVAMPFIIWPRAIYPISIPYRTSPIAMNWGCSMWKTLPTKMNWTDWRICI